jgi:hypothetical protein
VAVMAKAAKALFFAPGVLSEERAAAIFMI